MWKVCFRKGLLGKVGEKSRGWWLMTGIQGSPVHDTHLNVR